MMAPTLGYIAFFAFSISSSPHLKLIPSSKHSQRGGYRQEPLAHEEKANIIRYPTASLPDIFLNLLRERLVHYLEIDGCFPEENQ